MFIMGSGDKAALAEAKERLGEGIDTIVMFTVWEGLTLVNKFFCPLGVRGIDHPTPKHISHRIGPKNLVIPLSGSIVGDWNAHGSELKDERRTCCLRFNYERVHGKPFVEILGLLL